MSGDDGIFDATIAAQYDTLQGAPTAAEVPVMVACLDAWATDRKALEFAIGTGRVALPLARCGVAVSGIDCSQAMIEQLRRKDGGQDLRVVTGDMASERLEDHFSLVFLVFNTIDNLTTQAAQVACFENAARHLKPGGRFVVETLVPPLQRLPVGETKLAFAATDQHVGIDQFDTVTQTYSSTHIHFEDGGEVSRLTVPFRYAWPAELDLMAQIAGMALEHRWADWTKAAFTATSTRHISVWRKPT